MSATQSKHGGAKVRLPPPLVFLGFLLFGVALQRLLLRLSLPIGQATPAVAGGVVALLGLALGISSLGLFKRTGQDPAPWKPSPSLIVKGPYRFTRNPIYVGMTLLQAGIGIGLNNLWIVLFCAPALMLVHYLVVLPEEAYLAERFGAPYEQYRATVRRYL